MIIRKSESGDVPKIIDVLKASLGEISSKKTEEIWAYKHINNPFGDSLVLVAEDKGEIIGVRAFMRWKWQLGEQDFAAYRAVDTATHPGHRGKGVFKKLTLKALEIGEQRGDHFVFNTPNAQSKPGYLKMGWKELGKLKIQVRLLNLMGYRNNRLEYKISGKEIEIQDLLNSFLEKEKAAKRLFTPKDIRYLKWRYIDNPLQNYAVVFDKGYFIAGYLKKHKGFDEFRVSEAIISEKEKKQAKSTILEMGLSSGARFLSISPNTGISFKTGLSSNFGPLLTFKNINLEEIEEHEFLNLSTWNYSLGDLELF